MNSGHIYNVWTDRNKSDSNVQDILQFTSKICVKLTPHPNNPLISFLGLCHFLYHLSSLSNFIHHPCYNRMWNIYTSLHTQTTIIFTACSCPCPSRCSQIMYTYITTSMHKKNGAEVYASCVLHQLKTLLLFNIHLI